MKLLENGILFNWRICRWWGKEGDLLKRVCDIKSVRNCKKSLKPVLRCKPVQRGRMR